VGSSSVRALAFDPRARQVKNLGARRAYSIAATSDGGAEIDPRMLESLTVECLDELHAQIHAETRGAGLRVAAVGFSAFWHSFCGVDAEGKPSLPILHLLDTRSASEVPRVPDAHQRTGCPPHSSYWPAKLLWLEQNRAPEFRATRRWLSFPEYFFEKLFGRARASVSMLSATGLWNQAGNDYDDQTLAALPIRRDQLAAVDHLDEPMRELLPEYRDRWPAFHGIPWYPAIGDGAANHLGSGFAEPGHFSLMAGSTGAMRSLVDSLDGGIPEGLWCYRVDRGRLLMGGALSNGGDVFAWLSRTLQLPRDIEARLHSAVPGSHGLTVLPFLAGERSPYWRSDLRAAIVGLALATEPFHIAHAALESVALCFRELYAAMAARLGVPREIVASGGALVQSPAWAQIVADALGRPLSLPPIPEASSRGAAIYVLERLGLPIEDAPPGPLFSPRRQFEPVYARLLLEHRKLCNDLFGRRA
jgi:gluconokinase